MHCLSLHRAVGPSLCNRQRSEDPSVLLALLIYVDVVAPVEESCNHFPVVLLPLIEISFFRSFIFLVVTFVDRMNIH